MKRPFYRIVVADSRSPRDGRFIETLGYYNPLTDPSELKIDGEKAKLWLSRGAQPTDTAGALLKGKACWSAPRRGSQKLAFLLPAAAPALQWLKPTLPRPSKAAGARRNIKIKIERKG